MEPIVTLFNEAVKLRSLCTSNVKCGKKLT